MCEKLRVVVINPIAHTITEEQLDVGDGSKVAAQRALANLMQISPHAKVATPVENGVTGDKIVTDPTARKTYTFLGGEMGGISVIIGRNLAHDAVVPLERVQRQVRWAQ
jgi:hypothetical protein